MNLLLLSAKIVSKAREDFPLPLNPVKTVICFLGMLIETFLRLFSHAPDILIKFMSDDEPVLFFALTEGLQKFYSLFNP